MHSVRQVRVSIENRGPLSLSSQYIPEKDLTVAQKILHLAIFSILFL